MKKAQSVPQATQATATLISQGKDYWIDACQRTILFWDVLRQRSDQYYEQKAKKTPNVLDFDCELIMDGSKLARPVNYGLVYILPPANVKTDPEKRPFIVIDPRAGQNPGIGGFKADSEIGEALQAGHPCYFVGFSPEPIPGQTIEDVMYAEITFLEKVIERHPNVQGKPCLIGNCQAGWAVMMLAAVRPDLCGPLIIPGSPLSYWAGVEGKNPMRYSGGLLGGSWMTMLTSDLGNGKFDGAWLVSNFESLNPSNTLWKKQYNLWSKIDTEGPRYLAFEKWWGGYIELNGEEMQWIVDQLFVGNRLATGEITTTDGIRIDLRHIRSPIICFCSEGDNITPPPQALGWIVDLYQHDDEIKANNQTIIYAIHDNIGHLGIFVSGRVARKEHSEFTSNIDLIDILAPGLYQAILTPKTNDTDNPELVEGDWILCFEPRTLADIRAIVQPSMENERRFATVRRVSEINTGLYRTFIHPFIRAVSNEETAKWLRYFEPSALPFEIFSDRNPLMPTLAQMAEKVRKERLKTTADNPFWIMQEAFSATIISMLDLWQEWRDSSVERLFLTIYDSPILQAMLGLKASDELPRKHPGFNPEYLRSIKQQMQTLTENIYKGGAIAAAIRALIYIMMGHDCVDERAFNALRSIRHEHAEISLEAFKHLIREQFFCLLLAEDKALAAIPSMLPAEESDREKLLAQIHKIASAGAGKKPSGEHVKRLAKIDQLFKVKQEKTTKRK